MSKDTQYKFDDYKNDKLTKPRDIAWQNWAKFENVGDKVQGFVADVFYRPEIDQFKEQRGITLEQLDGTFINVGIKRLPFILKDTNDLHIGDPLTIELVELKKPATKGFSPTKIFGFFGKILPGNESKKTVRELEAEDMALGGSHDPDGEVIADAVGSQAFDDLPVINLPADEE